MLMTEKRTTNGKMKKRARALERASKNPAYVKYRDRYLRPEKVTELAAVQMLFYGKNTPHYKNDPSYFWAEETKTKRRQRLWAM